MRQTFTVPGVPQAKERSRTVETPSGGRRTYTPSKTKAFQDAVAWNARASRIQPIDGPVELTVRFFGARRGDGDNLAKSIADALNGIAYKDDRQVVVWHIYVFRHGNQPRTVVELRPVGLNELVEVPA